MPPSGARRAPQVGSNRLDQLARVRSGTPWGDLAHGLRRGATAMGRRYWAGGVILLVVGGWPLRGEQPAALDVEPEDVRPGLVARYRSLVEKEAALDRVDAKPAFFVSEGSPHPR